LLGNQPNEAFIISAFIGDPNRELNGRQFLVSDQPTNFIKMFKLFHTPDQAKAYCSLVVNLIDM